MDCFFCVTKRDRSCCKWQGIQEEKATGDLLRCSCCPEHICRYAFWSPRACHVSISKMIMPGIKHIPEVRREMIYGFPNPAFATARQKRRYSRNMQQPSTLQRSARPQATFHAIPAHERNSANRPVQPIAGPWGVSMNTDLTFHRSGTGPAGRRAGRVPSLPTRSINPPRRPAIADGGR